ncbi:ATP-binding protein [Endozoicomonas numazuensis]|uniref:ATPase n=1 Tax=Endozoicomonas numazuensis TaxID=1137799 RepID=A0A081NLT5_9GAMM|nr:ATP-binding protein [Endozoicomonas numazuensis]KEQ19408.1 ATPase [Endozoicomonas numazuensis]
MSSLFSPFDPAREIGTITKVSANFARINLPYAAESSARHHSGYRFGAGEVGEFVFIEQEEKAIFGRIVEVHLPEGERLTVEAELGRKITSNPIGSVQMLATLDMTTKRVQPGIISYPRIGQHVYSAHPSLLKYMVESGSGESQSSIKLATFPSAQDVALNLKPETLFGRHCGVLGATGGGKSWTVARIVEEIRRIGGKAILLDATGEFYKQKDGVRSVYLGDHNPSLEGHDEETVEFVSFPYYELEERDLFAIFQPSAGAQAPKMREAIKSLKLVKLREDLANDGQLIKAGQMKRPVLDAIREHSSQISSTLADFEISKLSQQVQNECVWPNGGYANNPDPSTWGRTHDGEVGYCISLISRIDATLNSGHLDCIFRPEDTTPLSGVIEDFLVDSRNQVLRISLEAMPFDMHARELVTNAIGRYLLKLARAGKFRTMPLVTVLDEAHQFLNKQVGDENNRVQLDAFGLIAKEGRKYGLTTVLATQRPRDIPEDVLSQMGTLIVHRLVNDKDRAVVERACGDLDATAASFLPSLGQGEALVVGTELAMPMTIKVREPKYTPESHSAQYGKYWRATN